MINRNKKLIWSVLWILSLLAIYIFAYHRGHDTILRNVTKQYKASEIEVGYGRYLTYRNISTNIESKNYDYAKCMADLSASSLYDVLLTCLSDKECSRQINNEKDYKLAPELFDKKPVGFKYYPYKGDIRSCDKTSNQ